MVKFETKVLVRLDRRVVGEIREVPGGYQYFPKGSKTGGPVCKTLPQCKYSVSSDGSSS